MAGTLLDGQFGFKKETTFATPVTVDRFLEVLADGTSHKPDAMPIQGEGLRVSARFDRGARLLPGRGKGEITVKAELQTAEVEVRMRRKQVDETLGPLRQQAEETARIAAAAYREGGTDLLRLLDAQRLQLETQLVYVQALVDYRLAVVNLETAMGANQ